MKNTDIKESIARRPTVAPGKVFDKNYMAMAQGAGTNSLTKISTRSMTSSFDYAIGELTFNDGEFKLFINGTEAESPAIKVSTHKLRAALTIMLTHQNDYMGNKAINPIVSIPLSEYVDLCGKPVTKNSIDEARKTVKEDLNALYNASMEWTEKKRGKNKDYAKMRIITSQAIKNGNIIVGFSHELASYLISDAQITQYPLSLLKVDERNQSAYHIGEKLAIYGNMDSNIKAGTADIISVEALLRICPNIPSIEKIKTTRHGVQEKILKPFESALDELQTKGVITYWHYCNAKKQPLTDEQLKTFKPADYLSLYINFALKDAPDQSIRIAAKSKKESKMPTRQYKKKSGVI